MTGVTAGWSPFSRTLRSRVELVPVVLIGTVPPFAFTFFHHRRELRKIVIAPLVVRLPTPRESHSAMRQDFSVMAACYVASAELNTQYPTWPGIELA